MITRMGQVGKLLDEMVEHDSLIIHTGAYVGKQKSIDDPIRYLDNVSEAYWFLEQARKEKKTFIYTSTWDRDPNPYVASKLAIEEMVVTWHKTYGVSYLIFRLPSLIGKGVVDYFLRHDSPVLDDRVLEFSTVENAVKMMTIEIEAGRINEMVEIRGENISVTLLWELIKYAKESLLPATEVGNVSS